MIRTALDKPADEAITPAELAGLTVLPARELGITDLSGIEYGTNLTELDLDFNQISDLSPLASLTNLKTLNLHNNQISDISPLVSLTNLQWLRIASNQISDISPLASLTNLVRLEMHHNQISDISPLVENCGLSKDDTIALAGNNLDLSDSSEDLRNIKILEERGVQVNY